MAVVTAGYASATAWLYGRQLTPGQTVPRGATEYEVHYWFTTLPGERALGAPNRVRAIIRVPVGLTDSGIRSRFYRLRLKVRASRRWGTTPKGTLGNI